MCFYGNFSPVIRTQIIPIVWSVHKSVNFPDDIDIPVRVTFTYFLDGAERYLAFVARFPIKLRRVRL